MRLQEKHWPSVGVWAFSVLMSASIAVSVGAATQAGVGVVLLVVAQVLQTWGLYRWSFTTTLTERELVVDRARLPRWAIGEVSALDQQQLRTIMGRGANPSAWHAVRPWSKKGVLITLNDPNDPHPYWVVASHKPARLTQALVEAT